MTTVNVAPVSIERRRRLPDRWDMLAALLVFATFVFLAQTSRGWIVSLSDLGRVPVTLDPSALPYYGARTMLRMLSALVLSLLFTFTYATAAAKSRRAESLLIPLLDILQSVPILGFISVSVTFFLSLAPGRVLGAELAAVFAIFTSQAWNMAFSFYQSLRTVPAELAEAAQSFGLSPWMRFWRLEAPFAMPALVWNMMMSLSGGWFFVVAAEAITVGDTKVTLPGIGSYIALAIEHRDFHAILYAIFAMLLVILLYDQLLCRPLVAWADRFRFEREAGALPPSSWVLTVLRRSRLVAAIRRPFRAVWARTLQLRWGFLSRAGGIQQLTRRVPEQVFERTWNVASVAVAFVALYSLSRFALEGIAISEVARAMALGLLTLLRVVVLIALASLVWIPIGVWIGMRPSAARVAQPVAQFLAAFPANLLFPMAVSAIVGLRLNPDVWLSPLMILGTQWYILFNVIAGASALPSELRDIATNFGVRGRLWWLRVALPGVFPYYLTGAITASGGSWNASIVAEAADWGSTHVEARGLGSYIARATADGDFHRVVLGVAVMSVFVVGLNRMFWRPLYWYAERRFRMD